MVKRMRLLIAAVALTAAAGCASEAGGSPRIDDFRRYQERVGALPTLTGAPASTPRPAGGTIPPGVYLVDADIQPGTYRSTGATQPSYGRGYCMWSRHSTPAGGPMDAIIASDGSYSGQMIVTIEPGDARFLTRGCAPFTLVSK